MQRIPGISDLFKQTVKMALKSGRVIGNYSTPCTFMDEVLLIFGCFPLIIIIIDYREIYETRKMCCSGSIHIQQNYSSET